jgi:Ca2+-binding RTX toxin-like protein
LNGGDDNGFMFGNDVLFGDGGDDRLLGGDGGDRLSGGDDNDRLFGENGNDTLTGDAGNDTLDGGTGNDRLLGGDNNDVFTDIFGTDVMDGGFGLNRVDYSDYYGRIVVNLANQTGRQEAATWQVDETGGSYSFNNEGTDTLISISDVVGTLFDDRITGSSGNNHLLGSAGGDTLSGGGGNDTLEGGTGRDQLTGGADADWFVFNTAPNLDAITDFHSGEDTIVLDRDVFTGITTRDGSLSDSAFRVVDTPEPTGLDFNDRLIYSTWNGRLFYDPDGSGSQAATQIADFDASTGLTLTASDFLIV